MKRIRINFDGDEMIVVDRYSGRATLKKDPPFSAACYQRLDVSRTMAAIGMLAQRVGPVESVFESFAGVGWHSRFIRKHCQPTHHIVMDLSQDCIDSIKATPVLEGIKAIRGDAWKVKFDAPKFDWVHVDAQSFTLKRFADDEKFHGNTWRALFDNVIPGARRYLTVTDSAPFGLARFPQNLQVYERFGVNQKDWTDYFRALSERFQMEYGVAAVYVVHWAAQAACVLFDRKAKKGAPLEIVHCEKKSDISLVSIEEESI